MADDIQWLQCIAISAAQRRTGFGAARGSHGGTTCRCTCKKLSLMQCCPIGEGAGILWIDQCSKAHRCADANAHRADGDGAGGDADAGEAELQGGCRVLEQVCVGGEEDRRRDGHSLLHDLAQHACLSGLSSALQELQFMAKCHCGPVSRCICISTLYRLFRFWKEWRFLPIAGAICKQDM